MPLQSSKKVVRSLLLSSPWELADSPVHHLVLLLPPMLLLLFIFVGVGIAAIAGVAGTASMQ